MYMFSSAKLKMTERLILFNWVTFRLILPFTLLAACIFRFNLFTVIYGLFFLLVPLARSPNAYTIRRHTGGLIWALTAVSGLFMLVQICFQIALAARKPYGHEFPNCSINENITRQVGVYRLDGARFIHVARLVLPDVAVFIVASTLAVLAFKIRSQNANAPSNADTNLRPHRDERAGLVRMFTELIILIFVAAAGIISPSLISSIYFLCYMFIGTFWACLGNAEKLFVKYVRYALLIFCAGHLAVTFLYQMDFMQNLVDKDSLPARLTGLLALIRVDCNEPRDLHYQSTPWYNFISPAVLIILYYLLASHIRQWKGYTVGRHPNEESSSSTSENPDELSNNVVVVAQQRIRNPFTHYRSFNPWSEEAGLLHGIQRPVAYDVAHETVTIQPESPHSDSSSHHYRIRMLLNYFARVVARQSYIISLISMMAWSVIYHSWLTFVFLLLAIFLWLIPSSRSFCLKFSPVYTLYAEILVTAQFIFSLNIQKEFDDMIATSYIDFNQIGFQRYAYPVFDLTIQCLFTFFFWTTLRLFMHERQAVRNHEEHGVNLDEVTNGADPGSVIMSEYFDPGTHSWLWRIGRSIKIVMIKFWIVLCGAMLLVISMKGKVVIYRIVYMALLLCFVVMLQVSYRFWRKMLYVFWVTVIFYSMVVLLLIYTYQFKNFPEYWQNFTTLSKETLEDFGLESYGTKGALVVELLTPTAFLILCILQLHYFHKHFLNITSKQDGMYKFPSFQIENQPVDLARPSGFAIRCLQFTYKWSHIFFDFLWRLLEIHILKVCLFVILLSAVVDPSAINLIFILLVAISLMAYNGVSVVAQSSSTIAAVLVIVKMVYQLRMVKEEPFSANCSFLNASNFNRSDNDWVGFRKVGDIAYELRVYISVILIVTLRAIIVHRVPANQQPQPGIVFATITQKDADTGLVSCMKYLINFGFYRFGLEICFMTMVINMCSRLDIFAVMYGVLLLVMFMLSRRALAKIWGVYVVVLGLLLPIQYLLVLGIPRGLCITYPWDKNSATTIFTAEMVQWLYLPDAFFPPKAIILIGDFFQLLFACCQWRVFNQETLYQSEPYEGGNNENILHSGKYRRIFENPVPDFMTSTKSYLDFLKYFIFNFMFWVTLAILFIAGSSRISLLCFFYLLGCFFFLWHGNEFLRKPIKRLMRQWNLFLTGNVIIILLKVVLQVVGCVHLPALKQNYCWVIQLLGIACLKMGNPNREEPDAVSRDLPKHVDSTKSAIFTDECKANTEDAGLVLDAVVFVFLLFQKRIFSSWHFQWVVLEHKVQSALASRGAELIKSQVAEQTRKQKMDEAKVMEKIRRKVERIREKQIRRKGIAAIVPPGYQIPTEVLGDPKSPYFEEHYQTTRSGDSYMFEDSDSDEEDIDLAPSRPPEEADPANVKTTGPDPLQMLNYAVMMEDIKTTVQDIKAVNERSESERGSEYASPGQTRLSLLQLAQRRNTLGSNERRLPSSETTSSTVHPAVHLSPVHSLNLIAENGDQESPLPNEFPSAGHFPRSVSDSEAVAAAHRDKMENEIPENETHIDSHSDIQAAGNYRELLNTGWEKTFHTIVFSKMFLSRIIEVINTKLNGISKDFRFVADKLRVEKRRLKRNYIQKVREFFERDGAGVNDVVPLGSDEQVDQAIQGLEKAALSKPGLLKHQKSELQLELPDRSEEEFQSQHNVVVRLAIASYYALTARSELLSYFMIIILQMTSASVLSLPLPLMMFTWGTLSIPRPKRAFWVTVISYTMLIVLIKYFSQFPFIPDNWPATGNPADPLYPPKILGVEKKSHYASVDLALLLIVFFHRSVLKSLGLWRSAREEQEELEVTGMASTSETAVVPDLHKPQDAITTSFAPEVQFTPDVEQKEFKLPVGVPGKQPFYKRYYRKMVNFFTVLTGPATDRLNTNVYSWLFYCDFICFIIVVAFYWAFGPDAGSGDNIKDYFEENRIPTAFLVILIVQFLLMILERALYLRKNLKGKLIFQLLLVLTVHGVFFFYLPKETGRAFTDKFSYPVKLWYFVKCAYFLLSAYQIRSGYPTRILGNIFTYGYHYLNLYAFKCFILIPFLMELRSLMDWIWTDTSMSMSEWLKLEDIYANVFVLKCWRMAEKRYPTPRGTRYMTFWKYLIGGSILLLIILVIWFPLVLFSLTNAVGDSNEPLDCTVEINLGGHQPIYTVSARKEALVNYTEEMYDKLLKDFSSVKSSTGMPDQAAVKQAQSFIHQYARQDVWLVNLEADSSTVWAISPPAEANIINYLNTSTKIQMYFKWSFRFAPRKGKVSQVISGQSSQELNSTTRILLSQMMNRTNTSTLSPIDILNLYPFFIRVPATGVSKFVGVLQPGISDNPQANFRNVSVLLRREAFLNMSEVVQWWKVYDSDNSTERGEFLTMTAFIDKIFPQAWAVITGYGIVGLYISLVFVIGRLVRTWSSNQSYRIMYEDLPYVDRILHLCQNIYLVRENREYRLEEDLYAKLLFLYRSPETIFKWTKMK